MPRYVLVTLSMVALLGISGCGGSTNEVTAGGSATSAAPSDAVMAEADRRPLTDRPTSPDPSRRPLRSRR